MREVPKGWTVASLAEVATNLDFRRVPVNARDRSFRTGTVPYYGATGQVGTIDAYLFDEELVLLGEDGAPFLDRNKPKAYLIHGHSWVNNHAHVLRGRAVSNRYLMHYLNSFDYYGYANGTTRLKLTQADMNRIPVPVPPTAEQERIVDAIEEQFSRLDAGLVDIGRAKQNLARLRKSVVEAAVTGTLLRTGTENWTRCCLGDVVRDIQAGRSFKCAERNALPSEWGVIKVSAMTWGEFRPQEHKTILDASLVDPRWQIHTGDVLVSRANTVAYVGAIVRVKETRPRLLLSDKSLRLIPSAGVRPDWLLISLRSTSARRYIEAVATGTSDSMRNISQEKLRATSIQVPPIEVQDALINEVTRICSLGDASSSQLDNEILLAQALRSSVLAAAFAGVLVPQDPADKPAVAVLERIAADRAPMNGHKHRPAHRASQRAFA